MLSEFWRQISAKIDRFHLFRQKHKQIFATDYKKLSKTALYFLPLVWVVSPSLFPSVFFCSVLIYHHHLFFFHWLTNINCFFYVAEVLFQVKILQNASMSTGSWDTPKIWTNYEIFFAKILATMQNVNNINIGFAI